MLFVPLLQFQEFGISVLLVLRVLFQCSAFKPSLPVDRREGVNHPNQDSTSHSDGDRDGIVCIRILSGPLLVMTRVLWLLDVIYSYKLQPPSADGCSDVKTPGVFQTPTPMVCVSTAPISLIVGAVCGFPALSLCYRPISLIVGAVCGFPALSLCYRLVR